MAHKISLKAYNRLLNQWVDDGKAALIEQDDPSWLAAVDALRIFQKEEPPTKEEKSP